MTFSFRGQTYSATTGANGRAVVPQIKAAGPPGTYPVQAYVLAGDNTYDPSSTTATVTVTRR